VILDLKRRAPDVRIEGRPFRHGPRFEYLAKLETQIVVEVRCRVLLNDETKMRRGSDLSTVSARLRGPVEIAFRAVV